MPTPGRLLTRLCPALGLLLALAAPLRAYPPVYSVRQTIRLSDLAASGSPLPMNVTGLNAAGRLVGLYSNTTKSRGLTTTSVHVLAWDDATQTLLPVLDSLGTSAQGMATGVSAAGWIGGVCWTTDPGGASGQWGFVWQDGTLTTFAAPDGNDIDTVVAVNNLGQAVGTYYGAAGYLRAFLWDGNTSTDLGDLGDPDNDYVWPVSLNDAGQVAGTVYDESNPVGLPPTTAFQWQASTGLTAVDGSSGGDGGFDHTAATAQNGAGGIIGRYLAPPSPKSGYNPVPGSFYGINNVLTDLGSLGGGGTVPFFLDEAGTVTGTGYAADRTLHLFDWPGTGALADLGAAALRPDDTGFALTGVNQGGDLVGFSTDAGGQVHLCLRASESRTLYDLAGLTTPALAFTPDDSDGRQAFVNDAGLVAAAGFDPATGTPEVLLLTPDADNNGLPDGWEMAYFHHTGVNPNGDDDHDGESNWQEYNAGTDPTDFYDGQAPALAVVGGGNQRGIPGDWLPVALSVQVDAGRYGAPLTFAVTDGTALLATNLNATPTASVQTTASTPYTAPGGTRQYVAQVYVYLLNASTGTTGNSVSTVTVTAQPKGGDAATVTTTEIASDPNLSAPGGLSLGGNSATTIDLSWTPSDLSLATAVEVSYDQGATWSLQTTFDAGVSAGRVYHLAPDHVVFFRLSTVGADTGGGGGGNANATGGNASVPTDPGQRELLSVPVVEGEAASVSRVNWCYLSFQDVPPNYFLMQVDRITWPDDGGPVAVYDTTYDPASNTASGGWNNVEPPETDAYTGWTIVDDVTAYAQSTIPFAAKDTGTLSKSYSLAQFASLVEGAAVSFLGQRSDGVDSAGLHFGPAPLSYPPPDVDAGYDYAPGTVFGVVGETFDHRYAISRLQYTFRANADPNGVVVWDVIFTPEDGTDPVHEIHSMPTHGATEISADADGHPFLLDPTVLNNKQNGTYQVVPIQLQPRDYADNADGSGQSVTNSVGQTNDSTTPYDGQAGVIGDLVRSAFSPSTTKHFVTPKTGGMPFVDSFHPYVDIVAQIPHELEGQFSTYYDWVAKDADTGATVGTAQGSDYFVSRDQPGHYVVSLVTKVKVPLQPVVIDTVHVWVVWATGRVTYPDSSPMKTDVLAEPGKDLMKNYDEAPDVKTKLDKEICFVFTITPASIAALGADVPDLTGKNDTAPPGSGPETYRGPGYGDLRNGVNAHWDVSRRMMFSIQNPYSIPQAYFSALYGDYYSKPIPDGVMISYSTLPTGNDDAETLGEDNDPYHECVGTFNKHKVGEISSYDYPNLLTMDPAGTEGTQPHPTLQQEYDMQEFARLEIGRKWYTISDMFNWFMISRLKFNETWEDDGSSAGFSNPQ